MKSKKIKVKINAFDQLSESDIKAAFKRGIIKIGDYEIIVSKKLKQYIKKQLKINTPENTVIEAKAINQEGKPKLKYTYYKRNEPVTVYYTLTQISRKISSYKTKLKQTTNEAAKKNRADWLLFWTEQREKLKNEQ